jgi:predicted enzyme related to lactoylglutathione lyase
MAETRVAIANKPGWVDLASSDPAASRGFYSGLFGWQIEVMGPEFGEYGMARIDGQDVAGISPKMSPEAPTAWSVYIGTEDAESLTRKVGSGGGTVVVPPMDVGDSGRMAVFQDPAGAFISAWQPKQMRGFTHQGPGAFAWAELNARGIERVLPFYQEVFGWTVKSSEMGEGMPPYREFQIDGGSVAGGMEMPAVVPAEVPNHWLVYFGVENVDAKFARAIELGAGELVAPRDYPGGRFAVLGDPQRAAFGLMSTTH